MLTTTDARSLALLYHLNSEPWRNAEAYEADNYEVHFKAIEPVGDVVVLPDVARVDGLTTLIQRRRSCRSYAAAPMSLDQLAELIAGACAPTQVALLPNGLEMDVRAAPSAGGLYPLELYLLLDNVEEVVDGLYHYSISDHRLEPLRLGIDRDELRGMLLAQPFLENANVILFVAAVFDRTLTKYGARGYRYILLEAGHLAQNLCLLATERGLGTLCVGGFMDAKANAFLKLDSRVEAAVYCVGVGTAAAP